MFHVSNRSFVSVPAFLLTLLMTGFLLAYPVGPAFNLEQLNAKADIIVKVIVLEIEPLEDEWFGKTQGFEAVTSKLQVVSVIKGEVDEDEIEFQHYSISSRDYIDMFGVQSYELEPGRPYIVLAKKTDEPAVFRQCWKNHTIKMDQGVLLASSDYSINTDSLKETYWNELTGFLSPNYEGDDRDSDVSYAISQLDQMSNIHDWMGVNHFDRATALGQIAPFINDDSTSISQLAIKVLASGNPYSTQGDDPFWLSSKGDGYIPGLSDNFRDYINLGGQLYWKKLVELADSDTDVETRTMAIRALGTVARPEIFDRIKTWLSDDHVGIRSAATALLGDFPGEASKTLLENAVGDGSELIRQAAAQAIGYGQQANCLELLETLLSDNSPKVASSAALCLLSFSIELNVEALERNLQHNSFGLFFAIALARKGDQGPEPFLDQLCKAASISIFDPTANANWWGGQHISGQAREILLEYAKSKSPEEIDGPEFKPVIDALESPLTIKPTNSTDSPGAADDWKAPVGSDVPQQMYELYVSKGLTDRAKQFRKLCKKRLSFDAETYFKRIDESNR